MCSGHVALRRKHSRGCSVDDTRAAGPLESGDGILADAEGVIKAQDIRIFADAYVITLVVSIAVQDSHHLLTGNAVIRAKLIVAVAADNSVCGSPYDSVLVVRTGCYIVERTVAGNGRLALQTIEDGHDHTAGSRQSRAECRTASTHHQAVFIDIFHIIIEPVTVFDVREWELDAI